MRKILRQMPMVLSLLIALYSCKSSKESMVQRKADFEQSKEVSSGCFVQMKNGTIKNYTSLKLITGVLKTPYLLADGKIKIKGSEIKAYQNNDHYAISQVNFTSGHRSYVATETLPGFAIRINKGRINVYTKKYFNGSTAVDEYFLQKGDGGEILAYTAESMNIMIKDDTEALDFFISKKYDTPKSKKDQASASFANDIQLITRNK